MKTFDDLYAYDKRGKFRVFKIEIIGETSSNTVVIKSFTGLLNGKLREDNSIINRGKNIGKTNETIPYEQAIIVAQASWNKKVDEGYKSISMLLDKAGSVYVKMDLIGDIEAQLTYLFKTIGTEGYNTTKEWHEMPMLAQVFEKVKYKPLYIACQPKLNGVRCIAKYIEDTDEVLLISRGGMYYDLPHIKEELIGFMRTYPKMVLDGELYHHEKSLQEISGAVRKQSDNTLFDERDWLQYHIYDIAVPNVVFGIRFTKLYERFNLYSFSHKDRIQIVETSTLKLDEVEDYHNKAVNNGYEGLIVRDLYANYAFGFRDACLMKVKHYQDEEFTIIGCKIDGSKTIGESFVFELRDNNSPQTFFARPMGSITQKEYWFNNPTSWLNKEATVRFQERSDSGLPTQGHVRIESIRDYE